VNLPLPIRVRSVSAVMADLVLKIGVLIQYGKHLCVPKTSSASCDEMVFADQATDTSVLSDPVMVEIDWFG